MMTMKKESAGEDEVVQPPSEDESIVWSVGPSNVMLASSRNGLDRTELARTSRRARRVADCEPEWSHQ